MSAYFFPMQIFLYAQATHSKAGSICTSYLTHRHHLAESAAEHQALRCPLQDVATGSEKSVEQLLGMAALQPDPQQLQYTC